MHSIGSWVCLSFTLELVGFIVICIIFLLLSTYTVRDRFCYLYEECAN